MKLKAVSCYEELVLRLYKLLGMCGIVILFWFCFSSVLKKTWDSVWNEFFGSFQRNVVRFGYYSYLLLM